MTETEPCRSRAVIRLDDPERVLDELLGHMTEHAQVIRHEDGARIESPFGSVEILRLSDTVIVDVMAPGPEILAMIRHFIAEHVFEFAGEDAQIDWSGDGVEASLPPQFRQVRVLETLDLTPGMRRVVFACDRPEIYTGDVGYHIRILLPPRGRKPQWPVQRADGRLEWPTGEDALTSRVYTIRAVDPAAGTISVDFVLHDAGHAPGADFARAAMPGDVVGLMGPGGDGRPEAGRLLLLGDAAAIPAIARMLEELPPDTEVCALIEVGSDAERQPITLPSGAELFWLCRDGTTNYDGALLEQALQARLDTGTLDGVSVWAGCEKSVAGRMRKALVGRFPDRKKAFRIYAYWQLAAA